MGKEYVGLEMCLLLFESSDVITASNFSDEQKETGIDVGSTWWHE